MIHIRLVDSTLAELSFTARQTPRAWQEEALDAWGQNGQRGVVSVVTGGGKTTFAGQCMLKFESQSTDAHFVIIVPSLALVAQWRAALIADFGARDEDFSTFGANPRPSRISILVINSARRLAPVLAAQHESSMLIVDECHRAGSPENAKALGGSYAATLGLSATPVREFDDGFVEYIEPRLGPVIYSYGYQSASAESVIVRFDLQNILVPLEEDEREKYERLSKQIARASAKRIVGSSEPDSNFEILLRRRARIASMARFRLPTAISLMDAYRKQRVIVFHESISQAGRLLEELRRRGHRATIYHSRISADMRKDNLRMFRQGMFDVIVTCRALDEGANIPEASVAVIVSGTSSKRQRIQRMGRVLRPAKGKEAALIITFYSTTVEEKRLISEAETLPGARSIVWLRTERNK